MPSLSKATVLLLLSLTKGKNDQSSEALLPDSCLLACSVKYDTTNAIARLFGRLFPEAGLYNVNDPISSTLVSLRTRISRCSDS